LLTFGNEVLVVSKPHLDCVKELCRVCEGHKDKVMFRFSIGSYSDRLLSYWEPNAPCFEERYNSLHYAFRAGFKTSISCEPCLDTSRVCELFFMLKPFITDSFWIGKMNRMVERVVGVDAGEIERINRGQTDDKIMDLYKQLRNEPLIRWKESYQEVLEKYGLL
jgi:DNA repair photolyase